MGRNPLRMKMCAELLLLFIQVKFKCKKINKKINRNSTEKFPQSFLITSKDLAHE